eukprot:gene18691-biopygen3959
MGNGWVQMESEWSREKIGSRARGLLIMGAILSGVWGIGTQFDGNAEGPVCKPRGGGDHFCEGSVRQCIPLAYASFTLNSNPPLVQSAKITGPRPLQ